MTGNSTFSNARRDIRRPVAPFIRLAGATGLSEPVSPRKIGSKSRAIWRMWVYQARTPTVAG